MRLILLLMCVCGSAALKAKDYSGYIIRNNGDTLQCRFLFGNMIKALEHPDIRARVEDGVTIMVGDNKAKYKPYEIHGFTIFTERDTLQYASVTVPTYKYLKGFL